MDRSGNGPALTRRRGLLVPGLLLGLLVVLLVPAVPARAESDDGWRIQRYHLTAEVGQDGTAEIQLEMDFDFGDEAGHGPYLVQSLRSRVADDPDLWRRTPIDTASVMASSPSGAPDEVDLEADDSTLQIRVGDPDEEVLGVQSYVISWQQRGLVTPGAAGSGLDEVAWDVIVEAGFEIDVADVRVELTGPGAPLRQAECTAGSAGSLEPCTSVGAGDGAGVWSQDLLPAGEGFTVVAGWDEGTFDAPLQLTKRYHPGNTFTLSPLTLVGGLLLAAAGVAFALLVVRRRGRDERWADLTPGVHPSAGAVVHATRPGPRRGEVAVRFTPPDDAHPGQVGTVLDGVAHRQDVVATLVDLAVRGHVQLVDEAEAGEEPRWCVRRGTEFHDKGLAHFERALLDGLLAERQQVELARVEGLHGTLASIQDALYVDAVERGWFRVNPLHLRRRSAALGVVAVGLAVVATVLLARSAGWGVVGLGAVLGAVAVLVAVPRLTARTAVGSVLLDQALGFKLYLATAEADQIAAAEAEQIFSRYLPYAIAFGEAEHWTGVFQQLTERGHDLGVPAWYSGPYVLGLGSPALTQQLGSFNQTVNSAVVSANSSPSSGSTSFGAGVGAGVAGGGGGGW